MRNVFLAILLALIPSLAFSGDASNDIFNNALWEGEFSLTTNLKGELLMGETIVFTFSEESDEGTELTKGYTGREVSRSFDTQSTKIKYRIDHSFVTEKFHTSEGIQEVHQDGWFSAEEAFDVFIEAIITKTAQGKDMISGDISFSGSSEDADIQKFLGRKGKFTVYRTDIKERLMKESKEMLEKLQKQKDGEEKVGRNYTVW